MLPIDYIEGSNRDQTILFPESLDEYIAQDNPVRVIDAFLRAWTCKHSASATRS